MARVTGVVSLYIRNFSKMGGDINLISQISFINHISFLGMRTCHGMSLQGGVVLRQRGGNGTVFDIGFIFLLKDFFQKLKLRVRILDVNKGDNFLVDYLLLWVIDVGFTIFVSLLT